MCAFRYGDWTAQPEVARILAEFLNSLGGTSWMNINNSYSDSDGNTGTSQVSHGGTCYDPYSHGKSLSDADVMVSIPFTLQVFILLKDLGTCSVHGRQHFLRKYLGLWPTASVRTEGQQQGVAHTFLWMGSARNNAVRLVA